jgi:AcrR family transcriptional regulator
MTATKRANPRKTKPLGRTKAPEAKRLPSQDRGQRRYQALLDAAEKVIAEVGVADATTNAIAARAGSGMGSLYRFFPNKEAIVTALADRYKNTMRPLTEYARHPELKDVSLAVMVDGVIDPLVEFFRRAPAYHHVFRATDDACSHGRGYDCDLAEAVVDNVEAMMAARVPGTNPRQRRAHAIVAVEFVHHMLGFAFQSPPARRRAIIIETKRLLALYSEMIHKGDDPLRRLR